MKNSNLFSERLKNLRSSIKLSQAELGNAINLSKQTINDMEHGRSKTTLDKAILLADYFDVSLDYLVGRTNNYYSFSHISNWEKNFIHNLTEIIPTLDTDDVIAAGIDMEFWEKIIDGSIRPSLDDVCNIANDLGMSFDYLVGLTEEP